MFVTIYIVTFVIILVCVIAAFFVLTSFIALLRVGVPFAPTPHNNIIRGLDLLDLKPGSIFYDLGCGDGRALIEAEKRGAKAVGFEVSLWAYLKATINLWRTKSKAKIFFKSFYSVSVSDADAIFCFLVDRVMKRVEEKLMQELKPGTKIVSYGFPFPTRQPAAVIETDPKNSNASKIYLYVR